MYLLKGDLCIQSYFARPCGRTIFDVFHYIVLFYNIQYICCWQLFCITCKVRSSFVLCWLFCINQFCLLKKKKVFIYNFFCTS